MKEALTAIVHVRTCLDDIDVHISRSAEDALNRVEALLAPSALDEAKDIVSSLKATEPSEDAMLRLYDFFVQQCKLERSEAQIRVAKIGNHFWDWDLPVIEKPKRLRDERKGCEAIRKAVERRKPAWDTSRRKR